MRIDVALVERGFCQTRASARHMVKAGAVWIDGKPADKPSRRVTDDSQIKVDRERTNPWVSRGGLKLETALDAFSIDVAGLRVLDVGASTGGFTDVLLDRDADQVVALDVGHGQLHPKVANDPRVRSLEGTNIRHVDAASLGGAFDLVVVDVSFISLVTIAAQLADLVARDLIVLVKPQFEVGPHQLGKGGIVRNPKLYPDVLNQVTGAFAACGLKARVQVESPIEGGDGNAEFLIWFTRPPNASIMAET